MELESFELALLRRPPDAPGYDEETMDRIQREHLEYHASLRASGDIATNGPVMDQPDESFAASPSIEPDRSPEPVSLPRRTPLSAPDASSST
jgi:hypothetical protein